MKKIISGVFALLFIFTLVGSALAEMPDKARSPNNPNRPVLDKITFIHYKKGYGKPTGCNNDGKCQGWESATCEDCAGSGSGSGEESKCYGFISKGAKWKDTATYYINDNGGLEDLLVEGPIWAGAEAWDNFVAFELFTYGGITDALAGEQDYQNTLSWGNYPQAEVIAVTTIWGYFYGPPGKREIVEFDILFDTDYQWGDAEEGDCAPIVMDLQNIATHEFGHGAGLDDLYESSCSEETLYGYSDYCEIKKRDLGIGDITGIDELY